MLRRVLRPVLVLTLILSLVLVYGAPSRRPDRIPA